MENPSMIRVKAKTEGIIQASCKTLILWGYS